MITLHGWEISQQMLLSGIVQGLAYAVLGAGIVLVYRASGVINFAVAAFGTTALAFMAVLLGGGVADWHPPFWVAAVLATVAAALAGSLAEWAVIRRLADAPRLVVLVATIGIAQVLLLVALLLPDVIAGGFFPPLLDWTWTASPELLVQGRDWSVLVVIPVLVVLLGGVPHPHPHGPDGARVGGEPRQGAPRGHPRVPHRQRGVGDLGRARGGGGDHVGAGARRVAGRRRGRGWRAQLPVAPARAVVALLARMRSLPIALVAGIGVGIVEVILQQNVDPSDLGVTELWLFLATLVIVLVFSRLSRGIDDGGWKVTRRHRCARSTPTARGGRATSAHRCGRALRRAGADPGVLLARSESFLWTRVLIFAIAGCSLTILTGWAGQVSLGQFGFAAVGGLVTVKLVGDDGILGLHHLPWGVAVAIGVLVGALGGGAHRTARAAHPRALPRGDHAGVRSVRVGVAGRAGDVPRRQRTAAHAGQARRRARRLRVAPLLLLPVPGVPARVRRAGRAVAPHRHRPLGDRGARQPGVGRGHDHLDHPHEAARVRGVGRHGRAGGLSARHVAAEQHARR